MPNYFLVIIPTLLLSAIFTWVIKKMAFKYGLVDKPDEHRKLHVVFTPLLGGIAIFSAFFIVLYFFKNYYNYSALFIKNTFLTTKAK